MSLMLQPAVRTDVGRRANNEDAVFATRRLAAVADGVGGAAAGEVASRTIIGALESLEKSRLDGRIEDALCGDVALGNDRIGFVAACRPALAGMSSTLTAVALDDDSGYASRTWATRARTCSATAGWRAADPRRQRSSRR